MTITIIIIIIKKLYQDIIYLISSIFYVLKNWERESWQLKHINLILNKIYLFNKNSRIFKDLNYKLEIKIFVTYLFSRGVYKPDVNILHLPDT